MKQRISFAIGLMLGLLLAVLPVRTAAAATVRYDFDRDVDMSRWQYLAWAAPVRPDAPMIERRLARAIEAGFSGRGYTLVAEPGKADFVVEFEAAAWRDVQFTSVYQGPAFGRTARLEREPRGALSIVVVNRATGRVAWHGTVVDDLATDPQQADKRTARAVEKLLKKFPARGGTR